VALAVAGLADGLLLALGVGGVPLLPKHADSNATPTKDAAKARALRAENFLKITEIPCSR
jgi:hypothetical protein